MDSRKEAITCSRVNQIDMVDYMASVGYSPATIKNADYWYCSPLRDEQTPSFKINRNKNVWYDHGTGNGGNLVDFGIRYHQCSVKDFLGRFNGNNFPEQPVIKMIAEQQEAGNNGIKILSERNLHEGSLLHYLAHRRINENVARKYCREVRFEINQKEYTAIGFKNDEGGFELRNPWFKGSSSPKTVTTILNGAKEIAVFEGFFDFLSYQTIYWNQPIQQTDFFILNSIAFIEKATPVLDQYAHVRLYLDKDKTGQNSSVRLLVSSTRYRNESNLYNGYKDLNEWIQGIGKSQKKKLTNRPG